MNRYIIPVCIIQESKVYNMIINARDLNACKEKIMNKFSGESESDEWEDFLDDLDSHDILIGDITDIETL